jgi:hypothetical protein
MRFNQIHKLSCTFAFLFFVTTTQVVQGNESMTHFECEANSNNNNNKTDAELCSAFILQLFR